MKFLTLLTTFAAAASAAAISERGWRGKCLCQEEAESIVSQYATILGHTDAAAASAAAESLLDENYVEISDSILSLEGLPLGTATFVGKELYIQSTLAAPPLMGINTLEVLVAGCSKVLWYWNITGLGSMQYEVKGFNLFTITPAMQISQTNLEFNSIAWGLDTGYQVIFPPPPTK